MERFTHQLLNIPPQQKRHRHHSHEHPGEHEAEAHTSERNTVHMEIRRLSALGKVLHGEVLFYIINSFEVSAVSEFWVQSELGYSTRHHAPTLGKKVTGRTCSQSGQRSARERDSVKRVSNSALKKFED